MFRKYFRYIIIVFFVWDVLMLNSSYAISFYLRFGSFDRFMLKDSIIVFSVSNLLWLFLLGFSNSYSFIRIEPIEKILSKTVQTFLIYTVLIFTVIVALQMHEISRMRIIYFFSTFLVSIVMSRILFTRILKGIRRRGFNYKNVIIIGMGKSGLNIFSFLSKDLSLGYRILGFFDDNPEDYFKKFTVLGRISNVKQYLENNQVDEVYVTLSDYHENIIREIIDVCESNLIRIKFVPNFNRYTQTRRVSIDFYGNIPVVSLREEPLEIPTNRIIKRLFDIVFSCLIIVCLFSWLFPILMLLVKLSSKGPVFFKQERSGEDNKTFLCYKFRTMRVNINANTVQATKNDSRITTIGRIFRKTNLDELPQFFNVLIGNMSVVGPRPHMLKHTEEYSSLIKNYLVRHFIKPGITGWSQVNGLRGETSELEQMATRVEYDIWYLENWSFMLDIKIIFKTFTNMIVGDEKAG